MITPWRSLGFFQPELHSLYHVWRILTGHAENLGVYDAGVTEDDEAGVIKKWSPSSTIKLHTPGTWKASAAGWHQDSGLGKRVPLVLFWATRHPTRLRWRDVVGEWIYDEPAPFELALVDNMLCEHCEPYELTGPRMFFRQYALLGTQP